MNAPNSPSVYFEPDPGARGAGLKVLVVTNMYPHPAKPFLGVFVRQQVESLRAKGIGVDVLFVNGPASKLNYLRGAVSLRRLLRHSRYDLIHAHYIYSAAIARLQVGIPIITTFHSGEFYSGWLEYQLSKFIARHVAANIVVSAPLKDFLPRSRATVIPCGVDLKWFHPMSHEESRRTLGLAPNKKLVLFAAAKRPEKRFDLVEQAFQILSRNRADVDLVVLSGQPPERVPLYMNACDVLVLASDKEGSPQVVKEAMACNLPIVSTPVGDVPEVIAGVEGCYLCSQLPEDIAEKLEMALASGGRTDGYQHVAHLALEKVADRLLAVYKEVLGVGEPTESRAVPAGRA